ncbi:elongator complex protein 6 [Aristolochia californica]|uniref:elongator complex protein 6 n=1 Tax=Aristolochia californica TaxID=171875 RepID=UPI0035DDF60B
MNNAAVNLLEEALGPSNGRIILVEDCVEANGAFILHHIVKRAFAISNGAPGMVLFVALAQPFSHYERILRKLGCNLMTQMENKSFVFFDMLKLDCPGDDGGMKKSGLVDLYRKIERAIETATAESSKGCISVIIDDVSLLDVACHGSTAHVLDFLHYCRTLTSELNCSVVMLNHEDIYSSMADTRFNLQLEHLADVLIKAEPLSTGVAADVHGQLTVVNKGNTEQDHAVNKIRSFHFRVKENSVEYFFPGTLI